MKTHALPKLTAKQIRVCDLLCEGKLNKEICDALSCHDSTLKGHLRALRLKTRVENATQLVVFCTRNRTRLLRRVSKGV